MSKPIIEIKNVSYRYEGNNEDSVDHVSLNIEEGEFVAILGHNGSGKSTLARLLNALMMPTEGEIIVNGKRATEENPYDVRMDCGMVFQNPDNQIVTTVVEEDCAFGLENLGIESKEIRRRVDEALKAVGMYDRALSSPNMLSGGQKQRVAIAGAIAMQPKIIIFDESTAMLDPVGREDILSIAKKLNQEKHTTVLWITHFMEEAVQADRVIVMDAGKVRMDGTPREVFTHSEEISGYGLDVPEMTKLANRLRSCGIDVSKDVLSVDEMVVELCRLK